ncbi:MAG: response regulator [Desulfobacterales bacterium]|nr:response regulator [Desulfobacterales bacterium]
MSIEIDETMQVYIDESLEHLADIENDFLAIEEAGEDIDEELVNKVYRAAHSIKGGAGFMGLTNIKDLTHEMENILGRIRAREMVPNPEIINILLLASDVLRDLINDVITSNDVDISEHVTALRSILEAEDAPGGAAGEEAAPLAPTPNIMELYPDAVDEIADAMNEAKHVYLVEIDLIRDLHAQGKSPGELINEMKEAGSILAGVTEDEAESAVAGPDLPDRFPASVLFSTILRPGDINLLFEIDERNIFEVTEDLDVIRLGEPVPEEPVLAESPTPVPEESILVEPPPAREEPAPAHEEPAPMEPPAPVYESEVKRPDPGSAAVKTPPEKKPKPRPAKKKTPVESSLRVHVSLLDSLMNLAGELVLGRNQLLQAFSAKDNRALELASQRVDMITSELQEAIMLTRMQPIGNVFSKFPRVVRDLASKLGKEVELTLSGKEVELDKTIIEAISDPLTHLVRNSVDHGIEKTGDRRQMGKESVGLVELKAYHEAGQVNIQISDDGKGLDGEKLAASAVGKGLITEEQAHVMADKEKVNLIFLPGFSTAKEITDVSGRGVGMDVVKTNLDKLGGQTDIDSVPGKGTNIRIKLPLTLAIIPSQLIVTEGERYAIPQVNLEELLRIPAGKVKDQVERVGDAEVVRLRGNLLPLVRLADVIGVSRTYRPDGEEDVEADRRDNIADRRSKISLLRGEEEPAAGDAPGDPPSRTTGDRRYRAVSALNIVVVSTGAMKYGLVVDELHDSEEIVVKPLGRHLKRCKGYAGATIMGDGRVALILDVANLARMAGLTSLENTDRARSLAQENENAIRKRKDMQSLLVYRSAEEEQFAIPLNQVERIEKIQTSQIQNVSGRKVMQYRGGILPLFTIDQVTPVRPLAEREDLLAIVVSIAGREVGFLGIGPVDAVDTALEIDDSTLKQKGVMGSVNIGKYTTLLVDIFEVVRTLNPEWFSAKEAVQAVDADGPAILYAEDSNFFRGQVKSFMEEDGYDVVEADDGVEAWRLLEKNEERIALVVTDIEMPNLDGFGLTKKIREDGRFSDLPIIALTTLADDKDVARGNEVGVNEYHLKLDREKLMQSVHEYMG